MQELKNIELRSDEVQDILTRPPHSLIRYGISIICSVIFLLFIGCFVFKYPDIVTGNVTITTENPPIWLIAKSNGNIKDLLCCDKQQVKRNELLAVIENPAKNTDIEKVEKLLSSVIITDSLFYFPLDLFIQSYELGEVQTSYSSFIRALVNYENFRNVNLTHQEEFALHRKITGRNNYSNNLQKQLRLKANELEVAKSTYDREKSLFNKGVISKYEIESVEQSYLSIQQAYSQIQSTIISEEVESIQLSESVKKLKLQYLQEKNQYLFELKSSLREIQSAIETWKQKYLLISPINGMVTFNTFWQREQFVESGNRVFAIIPNNPGELIGKMLMPSSGIGKVKIDQIVNIKVNGYPYMESGVLKAKIKNISLVPNEENYMVEVILSNKLNTTTGTVLDFTGELSGEAEVITEDRSLGERLLSPLKYVWEDRFK